MGTTPDRIATKFVVHVRHRDTRHPAQSRRLVIDHIPATVTTSDEAASFIAEILGGAWKVDTVLPIAESTEFEHVLEALDAIKDQAAPAVVTIPPRPCPSGPRCECHHEGI